MRASTKFLLHGLLAGVLAQTTSAQDPSPKPVPEHIRHLVFAQSSFGRPLVLTVVGADSPERKQWALDSIKKGGLPPVWNSARYRLREPVWRLLHANGYATLEEFARISFGTEQIYEFLAYTELLRPHVIGESPGLFEKQVEIRLAHRNVDTIDYTNEYEMTVAGVKIKCFALTFTYSLIEDLPGLPDISTQFKGKAKACLDPDDGEWKLDNFILPDRSDGEYLALLDKAWASEEATRIGFERDLKEIRQAIAEQWKVMSIVPAPQTDWRELIVLKLGAAYDSHSALYVAGVNRRNLAERALTAANKFLDARRPTEARSFFEQGARYVVDSNRLFSTAESILGTSAQIVADELNAIYLGSKYAAEFGALATCGPKCLEIAERVFLVTDFGVQYGTQGLAEAKRQAAVSLIAKALLDGAEISTTIRDRTVLWLGDSGIDSVLARQIESPGFKQAAGTILNEMLGATAEELAQKALEEMILALGTILKSDKPIIPLSRLIPKDCVVDHDGSRITLALSLDLGWLEEDGEEVGCILVDTDRNPETGKRYYGDIGTDLLCFVNLSRGESWSARPDGPNFAWMQRKYPGTEIREAWPLEQTTSFDYVVVLTRSRSNTPSKLETWCAPNQATDGKGHLSHESSPKPADRPGNFDESMKQGASAILDLKWGEAKKSFAVASQLRPTDSRARAKLREVTEDEQLAIEASKLPALTGDSFKRVADEAEKFLKLKDYSNAVKKFKYLVNQRRNPPAAYNIACCYSLQGERDRACDWLEIAFHLGFADRKAAQADPDLSAIRSEPRYRLLLDKK